jgi:hypothetical protein
MNYAVKEITGKRVKRDGSAEYRLQWAPTWEPEENLVMSNSQVRQLMRKYEKEQKERSQNPALQETALPKSSPSTKSQRNKPKTCFYFSYKYENSWDGSSTTYPEDMQKTIENGLKLRNNALLQMIMAHIVTSEDSSSQIHLYFKVRLPWALPSSLEPFTLNGVIPTMIPKVQSNNSICQLIAFTQEDKVKTLFIYPTELNLADLNAQRRAAYDTSSSRNHVLLTNNLEGSEFAAVKSKTPTPTNNTPDCSICQLSLIEGINSLPCGHLFHGNCLKPLVRDLKCPLCNLKYRDSERRKIFLN